MSVIFPRHISPGELFDGYNDVWFDGYNDVWLKGLVQAGVNVFKPGYLIFFWPSLPVQP